MFTPSKPVLDKYVWKSKMYSTWWEFAYEEDWVKESKVVKDLSLDTKEKFMHYMIHMDEYEGMENEGSITCCNDLRNYDGNTTWEIVETYCKHVMSEKLFALSKKIWNSSVIGVYIDHNNRPVHYYIDKSDGETADNMSSLPSGFFGTSNVSRGTVPAANLEIMELAWNLDVASLIDPDSTSPYGFLPGTMCNAGDDHIISMLPAHLLTGIKPSVLKAQYLEQQSSYSMWEIELETPPMMAGFLMHEDEHGRTVGVSLSQMRGFGNTVYPEYPRSAIGLNASTTQYMESAVGTRLESEMTAMASIVVNDIFDFTPEELLEAVEEDEDEILDLARKGGSAQDAIAALIGVNASSLDWQYSYNDLMEMGVPEELLEAWRQPIPVELTRNPFNFFSKESVIKEH